MNGPRVTLDPTTQQTVITTCGDAIAAAGMNLLFAANSRTDVPYEAGRLGGACETTLDLIYRLGISFDSDGGLARMLDAAVVIYDHPWDKVNEFATDVKLLARLGEAVDAWRNRGQAAS